MSELELCCRCGDPTGQAAEARKIWDEAYAAGQEDMRNRCEEEAAQWPNPVGQVIARVIRELETVRVRLGADRVMEEIRIIFDGPPSHESGRFVEVEDAEGRSINIGEWHERADGLWELRIPNVSR